VTLALVLSLDDLVKLDRCRGCSGLRNRLRIDQMGFGRRACCWKGVMMGGHQMLPCRSDALDSLCTKTISWNCFASGIAGRGEGSRCHIFSPLAGPAEGDVIQNFSQHAWHMLVASGLARLGSCFAATSCVKPWNGSDFKLTGTEISGETGGAEETEERIVIDLTTIQKERGATPTLENKKCKGKSLGEAEYLIQRAAGEEPFWSEWDSRREKTWYAWKLRLEQRHWAFGPGFHPVCCYLTPL
jgi:hypothetical protein